MTTLATRVREFAAILTQRRGHDLDSWITTNRADTLSGFSTFLNGLDKDHDAAVRTDPALQQRPDRKRQHQGQAPPAPDLRPSQLRLATQENLAHRLTIDRPTLSLITQPATEPNILQSPTADVGTCSPVELQGELKHQVIQVFDGYN